MSIKKSEIKMHRYQYEGEAAWYQLTINEHCVTEAFRTPDAAWKDYIKQLIDAIEGAQSHLSVPSTY